MPFSSVENLVRRTRLDERALTALAEADVFSAIDLERREALWQVHGLARAHPLPLPVDEEPQVSFAPLSRLEEINWDYRRLSMSTRGHPLGPLRAELSACGLPDARAVAKMAEGQRVRYAGLVICRQHPGTASGVTFYTLEDETGLVNLVVWKRVFDAFSIMARTQSFLGVSGTIQTEDGVTHIVVDEMWRPDLLRAPAKLPSRDFR
jgi:error-prone DNA polymerase